MTPVVYFAKSLGTGHIKIGRTAALRRRAGALAHLSPGGVEIVATTPGGADLERDLHQRFAEYRANGEWFRPEAPILETIQAIKEGRFVTPPPRIEEDESTLPRNVAPGLTAAERTFECLGRDLELLVRRLGTLRTELRDRHGYTSEDIEGLYITAGCDGDPYAGFRELAALARGSDRAVD